MTSPTPPYFGEEKLTIGQKIRLVLLLTVYIGGIILVVREMMK